MPVSIEATVNTKQVRSGRRIAKVNGSLERYTYLCCAQEQQQQPPQSRINGEMHATMCQLSNEQALPLSPWNPLPGQCANVLRDTEEQCKSGTMLPMRSLLWQGATVQSPPPTALIQPGLTLYIEDLAILAPISLRLQFSAVVKSGRSSHSAETRQHNKSSHSAAPKGEQASV